ncbi:RSP_2647 family RNA methyltransferase [Jannaschia sp. M317]|uniref:RSP_2647 family RNA methyltransferase n=1 Tax=Jannaschia sp. M317 TaxID=2867011 RepID=UPI0021A74A2E|nr:class I SAM-dependent rRNA methyltransferase [Jannaschia sp. M317]UWQ19218.1 class I SAM-dependent rRNA methyltransferase [Jannaschia sp. M317]
MNDTPDTRPVLRLKPKADAKRLRHGHPWVYTDDIVTDRRTRALTPGTLAVLQDAERAEIGLVSVNLESRIGARLLDRDPAAQIDRAWISARLTAALAHRDRLFADPYYRWIHAEADGMPGVVLDRFGDAAVLQPNAAWADARAEDFAAVLSDLGLRHVLLNAGGRTRAAEGLGEENRWLLGGIDAPLPVPMNGATYMADLTGGQKTGLFYDQRPNHAFVARLSQGARVLDVFSHVGGFGLAALAGGAVQALAVDGSAPALALATEGAARMGRADDFTTRKGDAFDTMTELAAEGASFEVVVVDPPAFAPAKPALTAGLRAYERVARLATPLVAEGGYLTLCSCSHAAELSKFHAACVRGIGRAGRSAQLIRTGFSGPDHPVHPQLAESGYLKALTFRLLP